ncbi:MAG: branched-chain amino acid transporter permease [Betaproteobacteria bacterium]|nr:branched-chain amino acid transporter permease [Betaproteobacteria bacterium]
MNMLFDGLPRRALVALGLFLAVLLVAPWLVNAYILSLLVVVLYFAYAGQAWNVMMGFAGQLSLGHSLYVGLGAYAAAMMFTKFGVNPWVGLLVAVATTTAMGAIIGFLAFRFGIGGVYFAILTIAFSEFVRVGFDHWPWLGGSGGLFLPVANLSSNDLLNLRGAPIMFYYVMLAMCVAALGFCRWLLGSRLGYYWQAIRENEDAAAALGIPVFRYKMIAVMLSSAMTAFAGVFYAFYYNNLFPEQIFSMGRSIEIILGPIIGGLGTLIGPIVGAFVLTPLADGLSELLQWAGIDVPGVKQVFYGICLLLVVVFLPNGIWPMLARRLGLEREH